MDTIELIERLKKIELKEGVADLRKKYVEKEKRIPKRRFEKLIELDPTRNKKYAQWIIKMFLEDRNFDEEAVGIAIKNFDEALNKGLLQPDERDIYKYKTVEELFDLMSKYEAKQSKTEKEKEEKNRVIKEGAKKVFENDKVTIWNPFTYEASKELCSGYSFCIGHRETSGYWYSFRHENYKNFYYVIPKKGVKPKVRNFYGKFVVEVRPDGTKVVWDSTNSSHSWDDPDVKAIFEELGIPYTTNRRKRSGVDEEEE